MDIQILGNNYNTEELPDVTKLLDLISENQAAEAINNQTVVAGALLSGLLNLESTRECSHWKPVSERLPKKEGTYFVEMTTKLIGAKPEYGAAQFRFTKTLPISGFWQHNVFDVIRWKPIIHSQ